MPNEMPLLLLKTAVPLVAVWVPASAPPSAGCTLWLNDALAVMSDEPLIPKLTLLLLLKTTVPDVAVCVPAALLTAGCVVCANDALAVMRLVDAPEPRPKLTLLLFEKTTVPVVTVCVPPCNAAMPG